MSRLLFFITLIISPFIAFAENESFGESVLNDFASPFSNKAKVVTYTTLGIVGTYFVFEDSLHDEIEREAVKDMPLGKASPIGDLAGQNLTNIAYIIGMYSHYYFTGEEKSKKRSMLMLKSTLYSGLVTTGLKYTVREPRRDSDNRDSFPSGHTTSAFAFASVIGAEHDLIYSIPAYTLATIAAFSRINDNKHYVHDVLAGAAIGMSYGIGLYYRQKDSDNDELTSTFQILPSNNLDGIVAMYYMEF